VLPEHLLIGLVREGAGVAAQILARLGADRASIVEAVMHILDGADPTYREIPRCQDS
jgi:ATP-dependent Clp protease ATP-binding subunit ClpC